MSANETTKKEKKAKTPQEENLGFLEKMLKLIGKYGAWNIVKAIILILAFGIVLYSVSNIEKIVEHVFIEQNDQKVANHDSALKIRKEIKPKMDLLMTNALQELGCDRVFVLEMHNGTNNTSGLPFIYAEMTYEQCKEGVEHVDEDYTSINLSRFEFPYVLMQTPIWMGTIDELMATDSKLGLRMKSNNAAYIAIAVLHGLDNELGYIGITYCEGNTPADYEIIRNRVVSDAQKVSILLDVKPEDL